ncbi:MAG: hypothetical protein AAF624_00215 [Bacteroidota bacterium]
MLRLVFCLALAVFLAVPLSAQSLPDWAAPSAAPSPSEAPPAEAVPTVPSAPTQVPIDGGLGLLALAGAGYAARRLRQREA